MSKVLLGLVTFGNTMFTAKALESCKKTVEHQLDFFVVVGKPNDNNTMALLDERKIPHIVHTENKGFPASVNDIYDYAFKQNDYDSLIIIGNDVIVYPYCLDSLIEVAETTDYSVISALQYDVRDLVREFPETRQYFNTEKYIINDLTSVSPWEKFTNYSKELEVQNSQLYDVQNCCLYKRDVFERIGYTDVNFYPAYFIDNDYVKRILLADIKYCSVTNARFFHFWSRTIHQGNGGSSNKFFERNRQYYVLKWGGTPQNELYTVPFDGQEIALTQNLPLPTSINIQERDLEPHLINFWKTK